MSSRRKRSAGSQPRFNPPRPPSTMPAPQGGGTDRHKVFVEIANLQMAKARQKRIREALQSQADRRAENIAVLDGRIEKLYRQVGLELKKTDGSDGENSTPENEGGDRGFSYEY